MDLIDRKVLLERMRENAAFATSYKPYMTKEDIAFRVLRDAKEQALRFVEDAPTIEVVPVVHGKWIDMIESKPDHHTGEYYEEVYYNCSICDYASDDATNFCPNCGAKMKAV